jgi:hypothetical protein
MHFPSFCLAAAICGTLGAQAVIAPVSSLANDANAAADFGGIGTAQRSLVLVDARHLTALQGKTLTELTLRRDATSKGALTGGTSRITVALSTTTRVPEHALGAFDLNHGGNRVALFQGDVTVPSSPAVGPNHDPWSPANTVRIPLGSGFAYASGSLCIDLCGAPAGRARYWGVDAEVEPSNGSATSVGTACPPNLRRETATVSGAGFAKPGGSLAVLAFGKPGAGAALLAGVQPYGSGIDLTPFGATGCSLYQAPVLTFPASLIDHQVPGMLAAAHWSLQFPADPGFAGVTLRLQAITMEWSLPRSEWSNAAGVTTSNGLVLTTSALPPALGFALVSARWSGTGTPPASGTVDIGRGPVLRIGYR